MNQQASTDQIDQIAGLLRSAGTLTTSSRGGWNGSVLSDAWIDYKLGGQLDARMADRIIAFLNRQASR